MADKNQPKTATNVSKAVNERAKTDARYAVHAMNHMAPSKVKSN